MRFVHLVIPDLFLPGDIAAEVLADLSLPGLQMMLGRGKSTNLEPVPLETLLCEVFGIPIRNDAPIAAISASFDGLGAGCWLRADPVHLRLQRDRVLMLANPDIGSDEASVMCAGLNEHFAGQGMKFFAPHPQRWYMRLDALPEIRTIPVSQLIGGDVRGSLPEGADAPRWHQLINEMQMLLYSHPLNESRAARGALEINSLSLWGAGDSRSLKLKPSCDHASSDDELVEMIAAAAGIPCSRWTERWSDTEGAGSQLLVWTGLRTALQNGDLAEWRNALLAFETGYAKPLWEALRSGRIAGLHIDALGREAMRHVVLSRGDAWKFWRRNIKLSEYSPA
jgi:hypothetical protein